MNSRSLTLTATLLVLAAVCILRPGVAARAQVPTPAEGAIDTSRPILESTGARAGQLEPVTVDLYVFGGSAPVRTLTTDERGSFSFGALRAGEYRLRIRVIRDRDTGRAAAGAGSDAAAADSAGFSVTLEGIEGGPIEAVMAPTAPAEASASGRARLDGRIDTLDRRYAGAQFGGSGGQSSFRAGPGRPGYANLLFRADGRTPVRGIIVRDISK